MIGLGAIQKKKERSCYATRIKFYSVYCEMSVTLL